MVSIGAYIAMAFCLIACAICNVIMFNRNCELTDENIKLKSTIKMMRAYLEVCMEKQDGSDREE